MEILILQAFHLLFQEVDVDNIHDWLLPGRGNKSVGLQVNLTTFTTDS